MSLRLKIILLVTALAAAFLAALVLQEIDATRRSVREEMVASNRVAAQLLRRLSSVYQQAGGEGMLSFLSDLGRVRANDITLTRNDGQVLYRSPPPVYKQGRSAPPAFVELVRPEVQRQEFKLPGALLVVQADPSRAILDGWDELVLLLGAGGLATLLTSALVLWLVARALRPFPTILDGLARLEAGDYAARLPPLPGREAHAIGDAVNRMAAAVEDHVQVRLRAFEAERRLAQSREFGRLVSQHTEAERRAIARELHDEMGQSVTAIRSLATALAGKLAKGDAQGSQTATLIADEAGRLYDAMHGIIPRLTPLTLDSLGLADTLADLVQQTRAREPQVQLHYAPHALPAALDAEGALAAYRVVQEALTNALRHGRATRIAIELGGDDGLLEVSVTDDGEGLPADWQRAGHYGLRGLAERVEALGGRLEVGPAAPRGARVRATIPVVESTG
jgi:two-component system sensor histidine kinase UhpB